VSVLATDGSDESNTVRSVPIQVGASDLKIVSSPKAGVEDGLFSYQVEVQDGGRRSLRYRLAKAPQGMTVDAISGEIVWHPAADQSGNHPVEVVVEDPQGAHASQTFEVTVTLDAGAAKPGAPAAPREVARDAESGAKDGRVVRSTSLPSAGKPKAVATDDESEETAAAPASAPTKVRRSHRGATQPAAGSETPPAAAEE
jgi:hypothetical protein